MNQCRTIWDGDDGMKISPFKKCCCPSSLIVTSERQFIFIAILFKWYIEIWGGPWFRFFNWSESDTVFPNPTILQVYEDLSVSIFARWQGWKDHVYLGPGHVWGGSSKLRVSTSASKSSIRRFVIAEKAPTRAFSWLKAATTAFTFKTLC